MRQRRTWAAMALALLVGGIGLVLANPAQAVPVRGQTGWSVLLCKFKDKAQEPQNPQFFRDFLTQDGAGQGGLADYFADQSRGRVTLHGSTVRGWYTMPFTLEQQRPKSRWDKIQDCVNTAATNGYHVPAGHRIIAILNDWVDSGAAGDRVLLDPGAWNVGFAAHEMLHGYGLGHSFSDDPTYRNVEWAQIGEYDNPWDIQSAMNIHTFQTARFGTSAVGLNGYFRDKLGWLGRDRVFTLGADGVRTRTITLSALETPGTAGTQLLRIPFDANDPYRYYTVEFRKKTGWSAGIPADIVLLNEVRNGTPYLLRTRGGDRHPVQSLDANGVSVRINGVSGNTATVTVSTNTVQGNTYGPNACKSGWVWRDGDQQDYVCVSHAVRQQNATDNNLASTRWYNGPYGPHTCVQGFVWRDAWPGDDVCVTPANRQQARNDNAAVYSRIERP
ncbi:hypothetical protein [Crossiella sp. CA198]|uniref:hypothetical protein n=1 Tax=Crossiella sp. CA198 TaxID=3455607 RepID=UPI003F8D26ED